MGGKVIVSGEQSSVVGYYTIDETKLNQWVLFTNENSGSRGLIALSEILKYKTFRVIEDYSYGKLYPTDKTYNGARIGITEEELTQFCIKL